jgi:adenosine/AMP kinase
MAATPLSLEGIHLTPLVILMENVPVFSIVPIKKPGDTNFILGQSHFIKTAEDIAEAVTGSVPGAKFGLAFCEASGDCLIRVEGNDESLILLAKENARTIAAGHTFILFLGDCYPVNVLNAVKNIQEVCTIFCATANETEVIIAESGLGRGIMGVIDGKSPRGTEGPADVASRREFLRTFGYKRG